MNNLFNVINPAKFIKIQLKLPKRTILEDIYTKDQLELYSNDSLLINGSSFDPINTTQTTTLTTTQTDNSEYNKIAKEDALQRAVYVAKKLIEKGGFTKVLAAAIAGTMIDENKCKPESYMKAEKEGRGAKGTGGPNEYGAGIGSWTGSTKKNVLKLCGYSPDTPVESLSMDLQIDMFIKAANDQSSKYKKYYDALRRCTTIEDASATSVCITGGVGWVTSPSVWNTHPTLVDAEKIAKIYQRSNDRRFGKSTYHANKHIRRLNYSKQVLAQL